MRRAIVVRGSDKEETTVQVVGKTVEQDDR
jgi:hypothetical protein